MPIASIIDTIQPMEDKGVRIATVAASAGKATFIIVPHLMQLHIWIFLYGWLGFSYFSVSKLSCLTKQLQLNGR